MGNCRLPIIIRYKTYILGNSNFIQVQNKDISGFNIRYMNQITHENIKRLYPPNSILEYRKPNEPTEESI